MITESDAIARGIDQAALIWPEFADERAELLRKILECGIESLAIERDKSLQARREAVSQIAGSMSGTWPNNWREEFRAEWPE